VIWGDAARGDFRKSSRRDAEFAEDAEGLGDLALLRDGFKKRNHGGHGVSRREEENLCNTLRSLRLRASARGIGEEFSQRR